MKPADYLAAIDQAWRRELLVKRDQRDTSGPRDYVWASSRRSCVRQMALDLMYPEDREEFQEDTLERFRKGNEREDDIVARLMKLGKYSDPSFDVIEGQRRFEIHDRDGTRLMSGKIDGRLKFEDGATPIFEVKSGMSVQNIQALEDFERSPWTRHQPDQLLAYLLEQEEPFGFFVLDRPGVPNLVLVELEKHLQRAESFLQDSRTAIEARFGRAELPPMTEDASNCKRCPHFGRRCAPEIDHGEGLKIITDPGLIEDMHTRALNEAAAREFDSADKRLKAALRGTELALVGDFVAKGKWSSLTKYDIPEDVKAEHKIVDPKGRWLMSFESLEESEEAGA